MVEVNREPIEVLAKDYNPWCKFGVNKMLEIIEGKESTARNPILLEIEDPQFGRLIRLLTTENVNLDRVGQYDHHIKIKSRGIDQYIRVKCTGGRIEDPRRYKGENEL